MSSISSSYKKLIAYGAFFFCLLAVLNIGALMTDAYYIIPWFDIPMHFLGGVSVGYVALAFLVRQKKEQGSISWLPWILLVTAVIIGWEIFEYALSAVNLQTWNGVQDTIIDMCMGYIGAIIVWQWSYSARFQRASQNKDVETNS
jgi:hypothetical protein